MSAKISSTPFVKRTGTTIENEPIIKSDGASSDVMQWLSNDESSNITISEDGSNNLDLVVSAGNAGIGTATPGTYDSRAGRLVIHEAGDGGITIATGAASDGRLVFARSGDTGLDHGEISYDQNTEAMSFATAGTGRLTIDDDGLATFSGAVTSPFFTLADADVVRWGAGTATYIQGSHSAEYINFIVNSSNKGGFSSTGLAVTGLVTASNGIVETNGVLKENLLTNSGFDVWSNSTLEKVGSELMTGMTNTNFDTFPAGGLAGAYANSAAGWGVASQAVSLTVGKLYELSFDGSSLSGVATNFGTASAADGSNRVTVPITAATGISLVFEASALTTYIVLHTASSDASGFTLANISLKEVTPGCVATDNAKGCDGWYKSNSTKLYREHSGSNTRDGSFYALKTLAGSASTEYVYCFGGVNELSDNLDWRERWAGRTVTIGFWVYSKDAADNVKPAIFDGSWNLGSSFAGSNAWEWMEFTHTMSASATGGGFGFVLDGGSSDVAYISQPILVIGSSIGSGNYSRPSGEIVNLENASKLLNSWNATDSGGRQDTMNLEAESNGVVPKGAKAVYLSALVRDSNSSGGGAVRVYFGQNSTSKYDLQIWLDEVYDNEYRAGSGRVNCDSSGDIYYDIDSTGSDTFEASLRVTAVELR